jgi:hypothetical protein
MGIPLGVDDRDRTVWMKRKRDRTFNHLFLTKKAII